ncbi:MAG: iron-sulfur cluster carrier protein ApbC [Burkholderiales bacterium]
MPTTPRPGLPGVKHLIAVASGKGGVGKSTVTANLALALQAEGYKTGVLDADIYGPSQPLMLGVRNAKPASLDGKRGQPVMAHGLQTMSVGYLIEEDAPMIWRGPMVTQALHQLLFDTAWDGLDFLVIDLPPGTGDVQLSLVQRIPLSGAVIVTTPQEIAQTVARKGLKMFQKVSVPVLGVIENMSTHVCSKCGHEEDVFGAGGADKLAAQEGVPVLGRLPLDLSIRERGDKGRPTVVADPDSRAAQAFREIARRVVDRMQATQGAAAFPKITIEES